MNLSQIVAEAAKASVQEADATVVKYIEESIRHITDRGDRIEDYSLVLVNNPAEINESGYRISMQYRIMPVSEISNLPIIGREEVTTNSH